MEELKLQNRGWPTKLEAQDLFRRRVSFSTWQSHQPFSNKSRDALDSSGSSCSHFEKSKLKYCK